MGVSGTLRTWIEGWLKSREPTKAPRGGISFSNPLTLCCIALLPHVNQLVKGSCCCMAQATQRLMQFVRRFDLQSLNPKGCGSELEIEKKTVYACSSCLHHAWLLPDAMQFAQERHQEMCATAECHTNRRDKVRLQEHCVKAGKLLCLLQW